jgi:hypothetical protein
MNQGSKELKTGKRSYIPAVFELQTFRPLLYVYASFSDFFLPSFLLSFLGAIQNPRFCDSYYTSAGHVFLNGKLYPKPLNRAEKRCLIKIHLSLATELSPNIVIKMFADITQPPEPLPTPQLKAVRPGVSLLPPLSRRGRGPGLVVLTPTSEDPLKIEDGVPSVLIKWAEEGYTVVQIDASAFEDGNSVDILREALGTIHQCDKYDEGKIGLVGKTSMIHIFVKSADDP